MRTVEAASKFSFKYPVYDQASNLFVMATIYDVTTGTPVLLGTVHMAYDNAGYVGDYLAGTDVAYLVVMAVYDSSYTTLDTTRSAVADNLFAGDPGSTNLGFNYVAFDQATNLHLGANLYDITTGTPVFVNQVVMAHVMAGAYFGSATGTEGKLYSLSKIVYTDSGLTSPDLTRGPGADVFQCFVPPDVQAQIIAALNLAAPSLKSFLQNQGQIQSQLSNQKEIRSRYRPRI